MCACEHASELRSVTPNCATIHEQLTLLYQSLLNLLSAFTRIVISMAFSLSRPPPRLSGISEASWNSFHGRPQKATAGGQTGEAPLPSEVAGDRVQYDGARQRYERANMVHRLVIQMGLMVPSRRPGTRDKLVSCKVPVARRVRVG